MRGLPVQRVGRTYRQLVGGDCVSNELETHAFPVRWQDLLFQRAGSVCISNALEDTAFPTRWKRMSPLALEGSAFGAHASPTRWKVLRFQRVGSIYLPTSWKGLRFQRVGNTCLSSALAEAALTAR